jgi:hypothetical protein
MNDEAMKAFAAKAGKLGPEFRTEFLPPEGGIGAAIKRGLTTLFIVIGGPATLGHCR